MKILIAHTDYQYRGGEDIVVDAEIALLREYGHEVQVYRRSNHELQNMSRLAAAGSTFWSSRSAHEVSDLCAGFRPDVIHVHNTFPLISPSLYWLAARKRIPLIQTLHNFRLLCPQAMLLRDGKVCEDCIGKLPWRAVTRKCYRDSALQSAVTAGMLVAHRAAGSYRDRVTNYIALNAFCRDKFIAGGLPAERIRIKQNFTVGGETPSWEKRAGGVFIGRLSPEKGLAVLIDALSLLNGVSIKIVGKGPLQETVERAFRHDYLGYQSRGRIAQLLREARYLVAPSTGIETFGLVAIEAFMCGTPVIASRQGGLGELVRDGLTGLLVDPTDAADLAAKIAWAESHPAEMLRMGRAARAEYEAQYTPQRNYRILINIYEDSIAQVKGDQPGIEPSKSAPFRDTAEKTMT
jgi:glycosyltransferase involved in cell wall biosynthesis